MAKASSTSSGMGWKMNVLYEMAQVFCICILPMFVCVCVSAFDCHEFKIQNFTRANLIWENANHDENRIRIWWVRRLCMVLWTCDTHTHKYIHSRSLDTRHKWCNINLLPEHSSSHTAHVDVPKMEITRRGNGRGLDEVISIDFQYFLKIYAFYECVFSGVFPQFLALNIMHSSYLLCTIWIPVDSFPFRQACRLLFVSHAFSLLIAPTYKWMEVGECMWALEAMWIAGTACWLLVYGLNLCCSHQAADTIYVMNFSEIVIGSNSSASEQQFEKNRHFLIVQNKCQATQKRCPTLFEFKSSHYKMCMWTSRANA